MNAVSNGKQVGLRWKLHWWGATVKRGKLNNLNINFECKLIICFITGYYLGFQSRVQL